MQWKRSKPKAPKYVLKRKERREGREGKRRGELVIVVHTCDPSSQRAKGKRSGVPRLSRPWSGGCRQRGRERRGEESREGERESIDIPLEDAV